MCENEGIIFDLAIIQFYLHIFFLNFVSNGTLNVGFKIKKLALTGVADPPTAE